MNRKSAIENVWRLTLASFAFAQIIGVIVVISVISSEDQMSNTQVLAAYAAFLLFSVVVFLAARFIIRSTLAFYSPSKHD